MKSSPHSKLLKTIGRYPEVIAWGLVKHSQGYLLPYYFNFRAAPSLPRLRQAVVAGLTKVVRRLKVDVVAGAETAGMAWAALVADRLNLPYVYVRKERKTTLDRRAVEGIYRRGSRAVLIDDTMLRGETKQKMIEQARRDGLLIRHVLLVYGAKQNEQKQRQLKRRFKKHGVRQVISLTTKDALSRVFIKAGVLTPELRELNAMYTANPYGWHKTARAKALLPALKRQRRKYERAS